MEFECYFAWIGVSSLISEDFVYLCVQYKGKEYFEKLLISLIALAVIGPSQGNMASFLSSGHNCCGGFIKLYSLLTAWNPTSTCRPVVVCVLHGCYNVSGTRVKSVICRLAVFSFFYCNGW